MFFEFTPGAFRSKFIFLQIFKLIKVNKRHFEKMAVKVTGYNTLMNNAFKDVGSFELATCYAFF